MDLSPFAIFTSVFKVNLKVIFLFVLFFLSGFLSFRLKMLEVLFSESI